MLTYQQAQEIAIGQARSFGQEKLGLEQAYGRVLAQSIFADRDYPPFHRATMDGYAIRYRDWEEGLRRFEIVEIIYAGAAATKPLARGECYKIMTGAPVPSDADTVIRREDTDEAVQSPSLPHTAEPASAGKSIHAGKPVPSGEPAHAGQPVLSENVYGPAPSVTILLSSCQPFQNIAPRGEDMHAGDTAIGTPSIIGPAVMGILASLGKEECLVEKLPRVALFTTGNEVVSVDAPVSAVQIRNSNRWILQSLLTGWGITPFLYEHLPDSKAALRSSLSMAITGIPLSDGTPLTSPASSPGVSLPADIIILSGGVSAGDADYVPGILEELGVKRLFHKITIKPGKPVWCGVIPGGPMVFALPGNPFSGLVGFMLLIQPYLHACFGLAAPAPLGLPLEGGRKKKTPLDEFFPVRFAGSPAKLHPIDINGSGDSRLGLYANAIALHPAGSADLPAGANVLCYSLQRSLK